MFITPIYASCSPIGRRELWVSLHQISLSLDGPWVVGGDFNVIAHNGEGTSRNTRDRDSSDFADMMMDCGLTDAGYSRSQYTWTNGRRIRDAECRVDEAELDHDRDPSPSHRDTLYQAQGRRIRARIRSITSSSGEVFESFETIQPSAVSFFQELLSAPPQPVDPIRPGIIPRLVFDEDNLQFNQTPTLTEVRESIFSIDPDSVAGLDGFSSHFFLLLRVDSSRDGSLGIMSRSYYIHLIRKPCRFFSSSRRLRQGDPISPSLFIIAADYFSRLLNQQYQHIPSMAYRHGDDTLISHLSFADDMIIFANGQK
ncbi:Reverse transcriptase domain-containing protein [Abeliophyllum distichum]|uniref:Reverse transcriptase domain-containing protein n=1 Tax=Abeliophyllum distichum TaxID=126358 RepID=A0ABD1TXV9_9LAMI